MDCPKCNTPNLHEDDENYRRAKEFFIFGLVLCGAGGAMHIFGVKIWPWWLYGIGGFVWFQALLKCLDAYYYYCLECHTNMVAMAWSRHSPKIGRPAPPLTELKQRIAGDTIERALYLFESECSEENVDGVAVQERIERSDGILVRYDVNWKHSVFDEQGYDRYVSWALLAPADPAAGDPTDARFRVVSASAEHHNL